MSDDLEKWITRQKYGLTIGDRIGIAVFYSFLALPPLGFVFAVMALFHLLPCSWYQSGCTT